VRTITVFKRLALLEQCFLGRRFKFNRPRALRIIVLHVVDSRAHRKGSHHARMVRFQDVGHSNQVSKPRIEPQVVAVWSKDHRHPIVDRQCHSVWRRGQDRAGLGPVSALVFPSLPCTDTMKQRRKSYFSKFKPFAMSSSRSGASFDRRLVNPLDVILPQSRSTSGVWFRCTMIWCRKTQAVPREGPQPMSK